MISRIQKALWRLAIVVWAVCVAFLAWSTGDPLANVCESEDAGDYEECLMEQAEAEPELPAPAQPEGGDALERARRAYEQGKAYVRGLLPATPPTDPSKYLPRYRAERVLRKLGILTLAIFLPTAAINWILGALKKQA